MNEQTIKLEERLIRFSLLIVEITETLPKSKLGNYIKDQLTRSGLSPAFNYGEAQFAESKLDFIHKKKICLKELKESQIALKFVLYKPLLQDLTQTNEAAIECDELISIFVASIKTTRENMNKEK